MIALLVPGDARNTTNKTDGEMANRAASPHVGWRVSAPGELPCFSDLAWHRRAAASCSVDWTVQQGAETHIDGWISLSLDGVGWCDDEPQGNDGWYDLNAFVTLDVPAGVTAHSGAGTLYGSASTVFLTADDVDADGTSDLTDNCTFVANTGQADADGDGFGNGCDADLNNDCVVNFGDLAAMKAAFLSSDPVADLNVDGSVNFGDLAGMKLAFLGAPGPAAAPNGCTSF